jgi:hypothetical protein
VKRTGFRNIGSKVLAVCGVGAIVLSLAGYGIARSGSSHHTSRFLSEAQTPCSQANPPCPSPLPPVRLAKTEDHHGVGLLMKPPPDDSTPKVSSVEALNIAWAEEGEEAQSSQPILTEIESTQGSAPDRLVWAVRYEGVCVESSGPRGASHSPGCAYLESNVLIDANTGEFLEAFLDQGN